jgi:hypothetical protein
MVDWISTNYLQITGVLAVVILLGVGRAKILPGVRSSPLLLWLAFVVTAVCGLILGWALVGVMAWMTSLPSLFGSVIGSIGAIVALALGWHAVYLTIALIRDLADKTPDEKARSAALWVPTFLPAGWTATWGIISNPRGLGTGITAAIMAVMTVLYAHLIVKEVLKAKTAPRAWRWFAALVMLLAGLVMIPLLVFADAQAALHLPGKLMASIRILAGVAGIALLVRAIKDIVDRVPDVHVRAFLAYGLPLLFAFGAAAAAWLSGNAESGFELLTGSAR